MRSQEPVAGAAGARPAAAARRQHGVAPQAHPATAWQCARRARTRACGPAPCWQTPRRSPPAEGRGGGRGVRKARARQAGQQCRRWRAHIGPSHHRTCTGSASMSARSTTTGCPLPISAMMPVRATGCWYRMCSSSSAALQQQRTARWLWRQCRSSGSGEVRSAALSLGAVTTVPQRRPGRPAGAVGAAPRLTSALVACSSNASSGCWWRRLRGVCVGFRGHGEVVRQVGRGRAPQLGCVHDCARTAAAVARRRRAAAAGLLLQLRHGHCTCGSRRPRPRRLVRRGARQLQGWQQPPPRGRQ